MCGSLYYELQLNGNTEVRLTENPFQFYLSRNRKFTKETFFLRQCMLEFL